MTTPTIWRDKLAPESTTRRGFYPVGKVEGQPNCKRYSWIARDGSIEEAVYLDVPCQNLREEIICRHYLRNRTNLVLQRDIEYNLIGRDDPWDFSIVQDDGLNFHIEITAIADSREWFQKMSKEELLETVRHKKVIPLSLLIKIGHSFPSSETEQLILDAKHRGVELQDEVANPYYIDGPRLLISVERTKPEPLTKSLTRAIRKKAQKSHANKDQVVLIVDNRTSRFDVEDFGSAIGDIQFFLEEQPFREIWLYTGYYSRDDGEGAEYTLMLVHGAEAMQARIRQAQEQNDFLTDEFGIVYSHFA